MNIVNTIITIVISSAVTGAITYAMVVKGKIKALFKSQCDQLRLQIHSMARHCIKQGYITVAELEAVTKAYESYHALGGNGSITALYNKVSALELREE